MKDGTKASLLCLGLFLFPSGLFGQGNLGAITGSVSDVSGALIPAATIKVTEINTNITQTVATSSAGYYRVSVPPGTYRVEAGKKGFKNGVWGRVIIDPAQVVTVNLTLEVGNMTETVVVSARPPMLNTSSAQVGTVITTQQIDALPTGAADGGRDPESFVFTSLPGTIGGPFSGSVNGGLKFTANVTVDGISVADYQRQGGTLTFYRPGFDAFSEVTVQQSSFSAEYGETGGGVINYQMRRGNNALHGDVFDFWNNSALSANGFDLNAIPAPPSSKHKQKLNDHNFGVSLGGPVVIPHIHNGRNRTFFYFTYEGDRFRNFNFGGRTTLPTPKMLQGDFSEWLGATPMGTDALGRPVFNNEIYNPTTTRQVTAGQIDPITGLVAKSSGVIRDPFVNKGQLNVIPPDFFSKASVQLLPLFPPPQISALIRNQPTFAGPWPTSTQDLWSIKVDHIISEKHRISAYFNENAHSQTFRHRGPIFPPLPSTPLEPLGSWFFNSELARFSEDWNVNDHTLNHLGIGYNRFGTVGIKPFPTTLLPSKLGIGAVANDSTFPALSFSGHNDMDGTMGSPEAEFNVSESYIVTDTLSYLHGKHSLKFGGEITRYHYNNAQLPQSANFSFGDLETALPGFQLQTGHQFASFILGAVDTASYLVIATNPGYRQSLFNVYFQDDWKVTPKLTINCGLRWDIPTPKKEAFNRMSSFDLSLSNPGADGFPGAMTFLGTCSGCIGRSSFQNMYWREFAPRIGLAYAATSKLVLRAGYGISWSPPIQEATGFQSGLGFNSGLGLPRSQVPTPFAVDPVTYWTPLAGASLPLNARVGLPPFTAQLPSIDPKAGNNLGVNFIPDNSLRQPQVQNWNFGFQYQLPAEILLDVNYLGSKGTYLPDAAVRGLVDQVPDKYMALGDILGDNFAADVADSVKAATLAQFGVTGLPYPSFRGQVRQGLRPFPQVTGVSNLYAFFGKSTYNTLQITTTKRMGHGLSFIAAYNWSKLLSDTSHQGTEPGGESAPGADYYNRKAQKTVAKFNLPQMLKLTWVYELPFGPGKHWLSSPGFVPKILGGWKISAIQRYQSGAPLTIVSSVGNGLFGGTVFPDRVLGVAETVPFQGPLDITNGTPYLNPAAFTRVPVSPINQFALRWGNLAPVLPNVRGPAQTTESASLMKVIPLRERLKFIIRADIFNVFNRTGLDDPVTNINRSDFGRIEGARYGPRGIQLAMRLDF